MLKRLFTSNARIKLLQLFLDNPEQEYYVRELTRLLDEQINSVRRELENLKKLGALKSKIKARKKYYHIDPSFILLPELTMIFKKASGEATPDEQTSLTSIIAATGEITFLVYSGIFIGKSGDVDLLIVANSPDKDAIAQAIESHQPEDEPIRFAILSTDDFLYRHKYNDRFITAIINDSDNIVAINELKNQIRLDF